MKKYILIFALILTFPLTVFGSEVSEYNKERFIKENLQQIIELVDLIPGLELSDLNLGGIIEPGISISIKPKFDFDLQVAEIFKISDKLRIYYRPEFISGSEQLDYWKIRVRCEEGTKAYIQGNSQDMCDSTTDEHTVSKGGGYVEFVNSNAETVRAEVKFRAFDSDGEWLASDSAFVAFGPTGR